MTLNWISIYDDTSAAKIVYVSDSIMDSTGWEPEEVVGREGYEFFHPDDQHALSKVHISNIYNEKLSAMVSYRFKCKYTGYVYVESIVHYCHDALITCNFIYDVNALDHKMRVNTVDEIYNCLPDGSLELAGAWNDRQELLEESLDTDSIWDGETVFRQQEKRFCLIMNRFTDFLNIVYISELAGELVSLDSKKCIGRSFYDFVLDCDVDSMQAQIDLAKEHHMVVRLRFDWVVNLETNETKPMEAITTCTDDGLVMVLRLSPRLVIDD